MLKDKEYHFFPCGQGLVKTTHWILTSKNSRNSQVFIGRSTLRNRKVLNANHHHHHLQADHQAHMVEFVILGPKLARMALSRVARQKVVGQKVRTTMRFTLQIASGNCWHEREARLLSKSTCVLIPFVVLHCSCFFFTGFMSVQLLSC